ncbi:hypothetical protein [Nitrosovibrio sp. Nv6]|nr:hypothetical protein [Nitrosovibrio sp. Nv6]SEO56664.1 hypothetical protein SAMN05216316_0504 [Nitrosovibrio sp. Nv6]
MTIWKGAKCITMAGMEAEVEQSLVVSVIRAEAEQDEITDESPDEQLAL